jgi:spore maturation protein CgeB
MSGPLRILAVADLWQGSNGYAYVRAFRRMGHSVTAVSAEQFVPGHWQRRPLRLLRRVLEPVLVREYAEALVEEARRLRPHLFFVFKGRYVTADAVRRVQAFGAIAINVYPDVSFLAHGAYLPRSLPLYDWIFTTKRFGIRDLETHLGVRHASFMPHAFDPEVHRPVEVGDDDRAAYDCDVSFIGTWSPKKQRVLETLCARLPELHVRVWGAQWERARATLGQRVEGRHVLGLEFAKAVSASRINLAILSEVRRGASSNDQVTSRSFHIPAIGGFMLHERTVEFLEYFAEDTECACFGDETELVDRVVHYLARADDRRAIATCGRDRAMRSGYVVDTRALEVLRKLDEIRVAPTMCPVAMVSC